jgi:ComF family protein
VNSWLAAALDLLFPPRCPACQQAMAAFGQWCPRCLNGYQLAVTLEGEAQELLYLDYITVLADYSGAVRRLLQNIKFRQQRAAAAYLWQLLPPGLAALPLPPGMTTADSVAASPVQRLNSLADWVTVVVPVPVHGERRRQRGYNQTNLIFQDWVMGQGIAWLTALERVQPTVPQYPLNPGERRANIKGAFRVTRPELVNNQHVLLVDDIFTSGITLDECAHTLRTAGAAGVYGLVLASSAR